MRAGEEIHAPGGKCYDLSSEYKLSSCPRSLFPPLHPPRAAHLAQLLRSPASRNALHSSTTMNASPTRDIHWISSPSGSSRPLRAPAPRYICLTTLRTRQLRAYTHSDPACAFTSYDTPNTLARLRRGICPARHSRGRDRPFDECAPCARDAYLLPLRRLSLPGSPRLAAALSYHPRIPPTHSTRPPVFAAHASRLRVYARPFL